jgi:hypothetical protein
VVVSFFEVEEDEVVKILIAIFAGYVLLLAFLLINQARIGNLDYFWHRYGWGVLLHAPVYPFACCSHSGVVSVP